MADPQLRLDRAGPVVEADDRPIDRPRSATRRRSRGRDRRPALRRSEPSTCRGQARDVEPGQIAADDRAARLRIQQRSMDRRAARPASEPRHRRSSSPPGRPRVGRVGRVDRRGERPLHAPARVRLDLQQVVETLVAQAGHVLIRERRPLRPARRAAPGRPESRRRDLHAEPRTRPSSASTWSVAPSRSPASISSTPG